MMRRVHYNVLFSASMLLIEGVGPLKKDYDLIKIWSRSAFSPVMIRLMGGVSILLFNNKVFQRKIMVKRKCDGMCVICVSHWLQLATSPIDVAKYHTLHH